jgi:hypothetical protein
MNIVYCFCGTTFDLTTHVRCPTCYEEIPNMNGSGDNIGGSAPESRATEGALMTDRLISDYLMGAVMTGLIKGTHTRSQRMSMGGFGGQRRDFYAVEPVHGEPVEYDRNGILQYVEMLRQAGVEPRRIF